MTHSLKDLNRRNINFNINDVSSLLPEHYQTEYTVDSGSLTKLLELYYDFLDSTSDQAFKREINEVFSSRDVSQNDTEYLDQVISEISIDPNLFEKDGKVFHTPSWTEVHPLTELSDIIVDKKPFDEIFVEPKTWDFKSESSDKVYTVKISAKGNLSCNCWGYIGHRSCKHVKQVKEWI